MADDDIPIEGSPADTADVTAFTYASTHASTSTPLLNTSSNMRIVGTPQRKL